MWFLGGSQLKKTPCTNIGKFRYWDIQIFKYLTAQLAHQHSFVKTFKCLNIHVLNIQISICLTTCSTIEILEYKDIWTSNHLPRQLACHDRMSNCWNIQIYGPQTKYQSKILENQLNNLNIIMQTNKSVISVRIIQSLIFVIFSSTCHSTGRMRKDQAGKIFCLQNHLQLLNWTG